MFTQEQLAQIEQLASIYIKPSEIAILIDADEQAFKDAIACPGSPARIAYVKGKMAQKLAVHQQMAELARVGSPLALEQSKKALNEMEDDEL